MRERALRLGATDTTPIAEMPWGERLFYARDPFGTPLAFVDAETVFLGHPRGDRPAR